MGLILAALGAVSLSTDDPIDEQMYSTPHSKKTRFFSPKLWKDIFIHALTELAILLLLYLNSLYIHYHSYLFFLCLIFVNLIQMVLVLFQNFYVSFRFLYH